MGRLLELAAAVVVLAGCATLAPPAPRLVTVLEEHTRTCRVQLVKDTRSPACFAAFQCGRHLVILVVPAEVCVP